MNNWLNLKHVFFFIDTTTIVRTCVQSFGPDSPYVSSQVQALMGNLLRLRADDRTVKCLVVSQFTRFLTILEAPLR